MQKIKHHESKIKLYTIGILLIYIPISYVLSQKVIVNDPPQQQFITEAIELIQADSVHSHISRLEGFGTRFELNNNRFEISQWIYDKFKSYGFNDVKMDSFFTPIKYSNKSFSVDSTFLQRNVICTIPGSGISDEICLLVAHYDTYTQESSFKFSRAPGADDNGSGVSCLFEIARMISELNYIPNSTIVIAALAAEELTNFGYSGAIHLANSLSNKNVNIRIVLNVDMIGYSTGQIAHKMYIGRKENSSPYAELSKILIRNNTGIWAIPVDYWGGDLRAFVNLGFPGLYFEEFNFNPFYHTSNDYLSNMNVEYCTQVIKGISSALIYLSKMPDSIEKVKCVRDLYDDSIFHFSWSPNQYPIIEYFNFYLSRDNGNTFSTYIINDTTFSTQPIQDLSNIRYAVTYINNESYESLGIIKEPVLNQLNINSVVEKNKFTINQIYPNPFNPNTKLKYELPGDGQISIQIYDLIGNLIKELYSGFQSAGNHAIEWDGRNEYGNIIGSGVYLIDINFNNYSQTRKITLLR